MRSHLMLVLTFAVSLLVGASNAQAVVVDMGTTGPASVAYPFDQSSYFGVALVPGTRGDLKTAGIPTVTLSPPCTDPALPSDLLPPNTGLCSHGGPVMHANETFVLTWDPLRRYFSTSKEYVEQFLRDVADGSGTLTSPYAVTSQYTDPTGRATNASRYGGACTDFGSVGGSECRFGAEEIAGAGHDYPAPAGPPNGCHVTGTNQFFGPEIEEAPNDVCLTDAQVKNELATMISQTGVLGRTEPGYTPTLVLLTPPGVVTCLDASGKLCSANGASTARFCSYHSQVNVGGVEVDYVVQPWTASWTLSNGCDEPNAPPIPLPPILYPQTHPHTFAVDLGIRLVSPLSQAQIAAIVNPELNGWFALDGSEINDNGCVPLGEGADSVTVGSSSQNPYLLQREFNNAGVIETDPNALACTPDVVLTPTFVVPSAVNQGDVVQFDGSTSASTLIVPRAGYAWDFGDGTTAVGPSVEHSYAKGGAYTVTLTVTDRGGNVRSLTHAISVLGPTGQVVAPPPTAGGPNGTSPGLHVKLQLLPESLRALLRRGVSLKLTANEAADGIASISIARATAKRAHIAAGRGSTVVIGRGTVKGVINGTIGLHLRLSKKVAAKIRRLGHVTLTISLTLLDRSGDKQTVVVAGRY
jgi:hypothetical protein